MFGEPQIRCVGFDYAGQDELSSIQRNLSALYSTPEGTCPGDRRFGLDWSFLDAPLDVAENLYALEVVDKTEEYEPRVEVMEVTYEWEMDGHLRPTILIGPNEDPYGDIEDNDGEDYDDTGEDDEG